MEKPHFLWVDRYAPKTIDECILPANLKDVFNGIVKNDVIPNMIFSGSPGTGKTTVARVLCEMIGCPYKIINASDNRNIDLVRVDIEEYATSRSFESDKRKIMILDEADHLNPTSTQPALRNQIEKYSDYCGFIFTCNSPYKIIEALHSRCVMTEFGIPKAESKEILQKLIQRLVVILKTEEIEFNLKVVANVAAKLFPDFRKTIGQLQIYANKNGKIDEGIFVQDTNETLKELITFLKTKKFDSVRNWASNNANGDFDSLSKYLYSVIADFLTSPQDIAQFIVITQKYQYENSFSLNKEIHILAYLVEIMANCNIKQ